MVKIRLTQTGKKNAKTYRIVVVDSAAKRDGRQIEILGYYNPLPNKSEIKLNIESTDEWIKKGAQMTERVSKIYNLVKNDKLES
jgi:small subunit ribosomal protein S16